MKFSSQFICDMGKKHYIQNLIAEGEHQRQDFKFQISDSKKIARTLVAFANTDGGRLLIGVKDNGAIAGIRSEEEMYMIETANELYCHPKVLMRMKEWNINGKLVVEVKVDPSKDLHSAPNKDGKFRVYIRVKDENILANYILVEARKKQNSKYGVSFTYSEAQADLMKYLEQNNKVTLSYFARKANISIKKAKRILIDMLAAQIITVEFSDDIITYSLNENYFD